MEQLCNYVVDVNSILTSNNLGDTKQVCMCVIPRDQRDTCIDTMDATHG